MGKINVLVADDDPSIAFLVERAVISIGYNCRMVRNGKEAQAALLTENFNLAILDEAMPFVNGSELAAWIKEQKHIDTPIILMSAEEKAVKINSALSGNQIVSYISKPFNLRTLSQLVQTFVRKDRESSPGSVL